MRHLLAMLCIITIVITIHAQESTDTIVYAITNGRVIDGTGIDPIDNGTVIVEGERITGVGASDDIDIPENAIIIDADGGTILPGIINAHSHVANTNYRYLLFTRRGVTTMCDMASDFDSLDSLAETTLSNGSFAGRAGRSGPFITVGGGYPGPVHGNSLNYTVRDAGGPTNAVANLQDAGATYIKIGLEPGMGRANFPMLTSEEVQEIVDAAHERDMIVQAHLQDAAHLETLINAGVDVLHHVPVPVDYVRQNVNDLLRLSDDEEIELPDDLIVQLERAVEADILLVPTLDVLVSDDDEATLQTRLYGRLVLTITQQYIELGGRIAVGNDYGNPSIEDGMVLREMQLLHEAGLSNMEVITAATYHSAQVCDMADEIGTLEPGKYADIIIVNGNPLEDLAVMDDITLIMGNGTEIPVFLSRR